MRVAFFVGSFPLISEIFILRQITGLIDLGHEVDIYADNRPSGTGPVHPDIKRYQLLSRTTYMNMPLDVEMEQPVWPLTGDTWLPGATEAIPNWHRVLRALPVAIRNAVAEPRLTFEALTPSAYGFRAKSLSMLYRLAVLRSRDQYYDVLHAQFGTIGDIFRIAKTLWQSPLVVSFRGHDYSQWPRAQGPRVYRRLFQIVDAVTVNTDFSRRRVEELGCPPAVIHKIPSALNPEDFVFRERTYERGEQLRVLTVGRLVEMKGVEYSIRAIANLRNIYPELRYDIVGDGPLRPSLEILARELGVGAIVEFHGARDTTYVREMLDRAHLFVLASVTAQNGEEESLGNVLVEAQASGLPAVATEHNGFPETIAPGSSGFLVPERDVAKLTERLAYLIDRPQTWAAMGSAGRAHVCKHYDSRVVVRQLADLYERVRANFVGKTSSGH